jgi:uncharacterized membrane protein
VSTQVGEPAPVPIAPLSPLNPRAARVAGAVNRLVAGIARYWLACLAGWGIGLIALAASAPLARSAGHGHLASAIYLPFRLICHQRADRSFHLDGEKMAFCQRDLAIVGGAVLVALLYGLLRRRSPAPVRIRWAALAALPMAIDGVTQLLGLRESTWELRVATGLLFSAGVGWFILPYLDAGFASVRLAAEGSARTEEMSTT